MAIGALLRRAFLFYGVILLGVNSAAWAQGPPAYPNYQPPPSYQPQAAPETPRLSPQDLTNLVAPIALYPDLLLSQTLAASTYPLELVQAQQWIARNPGLPGRDLVEAAKQQNWDPSVQALVAFPDVMNLLTRDIQWTTGLGNAFLSEQADVMDAIQQLRASAQANGHLQDTPQQRVEMEQSNGQNAITIQPTDPQVVYPPVYNPEYVWGPPAYGAYPPLAYPPPDYGIGYAVATFLGGLFYGLLSFGGWGWGLSWLTHGLFLNSLFFSHFGFHGYGGYGYGAGPGYATRVAWTHDPGHRLGVPYGNRSVAARYGGGYSPRASGPAISQNYGANSFGRGYNNVRPGNLGSSYSGGSRQMEAYRGLTARESGSYGYNGYGSSYRGGGSNYNSSPNYSGFAHESSRNYADVASRGAYRSGYSAPAHFSEPRSSGKAFSSPHYSAPKSSGHFGGGGHSGGHSHSGGGGHSHGGSHRK